MGFLVSPGVEVKEIDLTNIIPAVSTSIGAYAGAFRKGPIGVATLIGSEKELAEVFGAPTIAGSSILNESFFTAASFLKYGNALWVSRAKPGTPLNATSGGSALSSAINNDDEFVAANTSEGTLTDAVIARTPGVIGNSLRVEFAHADSPFSTTYAAANLFDNLPGTSSWASDRNITNDELNVVVIDEDGLISGAPGTILETYAGVSVVKDAKTLDGASNYVVDVIFRESAYIYVCEDGFWSSFGSSSADGDSTFGKYAIDLDGVTITVDGDSSDEATLLRMSLDDGSDGDVDAIDNSSIVTALGLFENPEEIEVNLIFAQALTNSGEAGEHVTVAKEIKRIVDARKDCVGFISPPKGHGTEATGIKTFFDYIGSSSYLIFDSSHVYTYNKYADEYLWIPACGHIAGLCARTDDVTDPWFSPAGFNRGQLQGVLKVKFNPKQADRDLLYKARINPICTFPGEGIILYGDKTAQTKPSAFDRINVRRLFIVLEKAIARAAKYQLFEFNDEFTRAMFKNMTEPFLRDVQGRRGITDFLVVCDETNNTGEVIDSNRFVADIYIKPARSINFITLNFIATRTGVEFNEIVGLRG